MKLISLQITPQSNPHGHIAEVAINHAPDRFTSGYICIARDKNGNDVITHRPPNVTDEQLNQALVHATTLITATLDIIGTGDMV